MTINPHLPLELSMAQQARDMFDGVTISLISCEDRKVPEAYRTASFKHEFPGRLFSSKKFPLIHPTLLEGLERNH